MNDFNDNRTSSKAPRGRASEPNAAQNPLGAPEIDDALLADKADNTVLAKYLVDPAFTFQLTIPPWNILAPSGHEDTLTVRHAQSGTVIHYGKYNEDSPVKPPLPISIEKAQLDQWGEGAHVFNYELHTFLGVTQYSTDLELKFDRIPPYRASVPEKFPPIADITDDNISTVRLMLPSYADRADGDKVHWFWLNAMPEPPESTEPNGTLDVAVTLPQAISVPTDTIRNLGDGGIYVFYALEDKAGNKSRLSFATEVGVAIGPLPDNLKDPLVPTETAGLVTQQDVFNGVQVHVLAFDNFKPTDQIRVIWGAAAQPWREIGSGGVFPQVFDIAPRIVWESYGAASTGVVSVKVAYEVRRGTVPQGGKDIDVNVNLERIGPVNPGPDPDPEWPDPVNPRLPEPEIYGEVSDTLNELLPEDEYEDARLELLIHDSLLEDDVLSFYWNDVHLDGLDHTLVTAEIGTQLEFKVPWAAIKAQGNGDMPVHYRVRRPGNPNIVRSLDVTVAVTAIGIHPEKPTFLGGNTQDPVGWLTCGALYDDVTPDPLDPAIRVQVPDLAQYGLKDGDTVTLKWTAVHGFTGETPIPGLDLSEDITLTATNLNGFVWRVQPYATHILPIYDFDTATPPLHLGRGRVHYEFTLAGQLYESEVEERIVAMHDATSSCPLRP